MSKFAPRAHLTAPVWNWTVIYEYIVDQVRDETWTSQDIWWGIETGAVDIAPMSDMVPVKVREKIKVKRQDLIKGQLFVFEGPIKDQSGTIRVAVDERATDRELLGMKWFVKGVVGKIE